MEGHAFALQDFCRRLNQLHMEAGGPSVDALARDRSIPLKRSQIYSVLAGRVTSAPSWDFIHAFVSACSRYARNHGRLLTLSVDPLVWRQQHDYLLRATESTASAPENRIRLVGSVPPTADCFQDRRLDTPKNGSTTVLWGLGGVGKTQLAASLVRTLSKRGSIDLAIWVNAGSRSAILAAYAQAGRELADFRNDDQEVSATQFLGWLANAERWVVVLDDLRTPADARELWPPAAPGSRTLVTTRRHDAALVTTGRTLVNIGLYTPAQSQRYLGEKLGASQDRLGGVAELASQLGHLPLALAQAAAYMNDRGLTCRTYLERFQAEISLSKVFPEADALPDDHRAVLAATWSLSIDVADRLSPVGLARPAVCVASLLDPQSAPIGVFRTWAARAYLGGATHVSPADAEDALRCLQRLSLLTIDTEQDAIRVHALVQRAVRESLSPAEAVRLAQAAADALLELWPEVERDTRPHMVRSNAVALSRSSGTALFFRRAHPLLFRVGRSLARTGLVRSALSHFRSLAADCATLLGPDHVDTLTARGEAAYWRGEGGDPFGAVTETDQLLDDRIRVLGPDHPDTLTARHHAAGWRGRAGDPAAAAAGLASLLADRIRVLGPDHQDTLDNRNSLAGWVGYAGDPDAASAALETVLLDRVRILGPDHPDTLATRYRMAHWHGAAGDTAAATEELRSLLEDCFRVFGPDHPGTLQVRAGLGRCLEQSGHHAAAGVVLTELLADQLRLLGPHHPDTRATADALERKPSP